MRNFYSKNVVGIWGGYIVGSTPYYNNIFTINTSLCLPAIWRVHLKREGRRGREKGEGGETEKGDGARRRERREMEEKEGKKEWGKKRFFFFLPIFVCCVGAYSKKDGDGVEEPEPYCEVKGGSGR